MSSANNTNPKEEQPTSFWKQTLIGIPYWLIVLVLLVLILYYAYKKNYLNSIGLNNAPRDQYWPSPQLSATDPRNCVNSTVQDVDMF